MVDVANYMRLLGHQGIMFKMTFKKVLSTKAFATQIKAIMEAQMARCAVLVDLLYIRIHPQHQLAYNVEDVDVLRDAIKLTFSYLLCAPQQHPAPPQRGLEELGQGEAVQHRACILPAQQVGQAAFSQMTA